jgi:hypothetical protein
MFQRISKKPAPTGRHAQVAVGTQDKKMTYFICSICIVFVQSFLIVLNAQ